VIERTQPRADGQPNTVGDTVGRQCASTEQCTFATSPRCDLDLGLCAPCASDADCAHVAPTTTCDTTGAAPVCVEPIEPRWSSIYAGAFATRCASATCHGARVRGELDLSTEATAYLSLVSVRASGSTACEQVGSLRVVPGDPDVSLLVHKLTGFTASGEDVCGRLMPLSGGRLPAQHIDAIREWIARGAPED
jgi:hypothetical protein